MYIFGMLCCHKYFIAVNRITPERWTNVIKYLFQLFTQIRLFQFRFAFGSKWISQWYFFRRGQIFCQWHIRDQQGNISMPCLRSWPEAMEHHIQLRGSGRNSTQTRIAYSVLKLRRKLSSSCPLHRVQDCRWRTDCNTIFILLPSPSIPTETTSLQDGKFSCEKVDDRGAFSQMKAE
jgi:hypothetical protein